VPPNAGTTPVRKQNACLSVTVKGTLLIEHAWRELGMEFRSCSVRYFSVSTKTSVCVCARARMCKMCRVYFFVKQKMYTTETHSLLQQVQDDYVVNISEICSE
jgi:hypothetical protein